MPKVSVILPNYNHELFLAQRLDSILQQSFKDFEIIILDDASTDGSLAILEKYKHSNPKITQLYSNTQNSGSTFIQWEKGIKAAQGQYLWIAESDDYAEADFLKTLVAQLDNNPSIGIAYSASTWVDADNNTLHIPEFEEGENHWQGKELVQNDFLKGNLIYNASMAVFHKELLQYVNFDKIKTFKYTGDWYFWIQMVPHTQVKRINQRLNFFRRHQNNVSFKSEREGLQFTEGIQIVQYILANNKVSFLKKRKAMLYWARKIQISEGVDKQKVLAQMPREMKIYYAILDTIW